MRNIELKAHCADLAGAEEVCRRIGASFSWTRRQEDDYFAVPQGRLKLRIEEPGGATLVSYQRADLPAARDCAYELTPVADPAMTLAELEARHGIRTRVEKIRTLYMLGNVRIHLDRVTGMGTFIEFEAVLGPDLGERQARAALRSLMGAFGIAASDIESGSYSDLQGQSPPAGASRPVS